MNLDEFNLKIQYTIFVCTITIRYIVQIGFKHKKVIEKRWDEEFALNVYKKILLMQVENQR